MISLTNKLIRGFYRCLVVTQRADTLYNFYTLTSIYGTFIGARELKTLDYLIFLSFYLLNVKKNYRLNKKTEIQNLVYFKMVN